MAVASRVGGFGADRELYIYVYIYKYRRRYGAAWYIVNRMMQVAISTAVARFTRMYILRLQFQGGL